MIQGTAKNAISSPKNEKNGKYYGNWKNKYLSWFKFNTRKLGG